MLILDINDTKLNQNKKDQKLIHDCTECVTIKVIFIKVKNEKMNFELNRHKNLNKNSPIDIKI